MFVNPVDKLRLEVSMALVSQQSFAKKIGVSRQRINFLVKNGTLAPAVVKIRGKKFLNEDLALSILNKSLDPTKQHNQTVSSEYQAARLENLSYQNNYYLSCRCIVLSPNSHCQEAACPSYMHMYLEYTG